MTYEEYLQTLLSTAQEALRAQEAQWEVTLASGTASLDFDAARARMAEDGAFLEGVRLSMLDALELLEVHRLMPIEQRCVAVAHALLGKEKALVFFAMLGGETSSHLTELLGMAVHAEVIQGSASLQVAPPEISDLDHRMLEEMAEEAARNWKELYLSLRHTFSVGWGWQVAEEEEAEVLAQLLGALQDMRGKLITLHMLTG